MYNVSELTKLFTDIFGDDYIEHHLVEITNDHELDETGFYVFVHCSNYNNHVNDLYHNRHVRNVLNSYSDICVIPPEEVFKTRKNVTNVVHDEEYTVNRTGFFMPGDIVKIISGPLSDMQGVVLRCTNNNPLTYQVILRLFVKAFVEEVEYNNAQFMSSLFKHSKFPVKHGRIREGKKRTQAIIDTYTALVHESYEKRLIVETTSLDCRKKEVDVFSLFTGNFDVCDIM